MYDKIVIWMNKVSLLAIAFIMYAIFVLFMRVIITGVLAMWSNLEILLRLFLS